MVLSEQTTGTEQAVLSALSLKGDAHMVSGKQPVLHFSNAFVLIAGQN